MIRILIKDNEFSYDVKALTLSFYPEQPCEVVMDEELCKEAGYEGNGYFLQIHFDDEEILKTTVVEEYNKNKIKQILYQLFKERTGKVLPWGILTGIRPAKIALRAKMAGMAEEEIRSMLSDEYYMNDSKIKLAMDVARTENSIISEIDYKNGYSLYIGIPFCTTRCHYCSFAAYPLKQYEKQVDAYLDALIQEMDFVKETYHHPLHSIYIGGGTPTSLNEEQFERLLTAVEERFQKDENGRKEIEFTVEAGRPDTITEGKLVSMKNHGVTRISINPQTMKQETLDKMGRHHTVESIREVFRLARSLEFDNINMDLIVGLPEETLQDFQNTMKAVTELSPDSITVHTLVIKRASKLREDQDRSGNEIQEEGKEISSMQDFGEYFAREHGYVPYYMYRQKNKAGMTRNTNQENVAYAKPGKECIYNIFIMEELETIVALGAGASSKYVISDHQMERVGNVKSIEEYIRRIDEMIERKRNFTLWQ